MRGIPTVIAIDDNIPYDSVRRMPRFAEIGKDGAIWAPLIEKLYAKIHGNYERIEGGWQTEAY